MQSVWGEGWDSGKAISKSSARKSLPEGKGLPSSAAGPLGYTEKQRR